MLKIENLSDEELEIVQEVNFSTPGCRIAPGQTPIKTRLSPGKSFIILAYEPGLYLTARPLVKQDVPREWWKEPPKPPVPDVL